MLFAIAISSAVAFPFTARARVAAIGDVATLAPRDDTKAYLGQEVSEPTQIVIRPYDPSTIKDIEKSILASDLGLNPQSDGRMIRVNIPIQAIPGLSLPTCLKVFVDRFLKIPTSKMCPDSTLISRPLKGLCSSVSTRNNPVPASS